MKSIQWGINILFAVLLAYLIIGKSTEVNVEEAKYSEMNTPEIGTEAESLGIKIRYINSDSIYADFEMVNDLRDDLETRQKEYRNSLDVRLKAFEQEVVNFQQNAQSMSQFEGQQKQKDLMAKEQELGQIQQDLAARLMEMETKMQKDIREKVLLYLEKFKGTGIDFVLDYSSNSSVLMAHDTFDITKEVVDSLNAEYALFKLK